MAKALMIVNASPKVNGTCSQVINDFITQLPRDIKVKLFNAYSLGAKPCMSCGYCKKCDGCMFNDLDEYFSCYAQADYVLFVSPVYNYSFPAPMKAIIDRSQRYYSKHFFRGEKPTFEREKSCGVIIVSGSNDLQCANIMVLSLKKMLSVMSGSIKAEMSIKNTDGDFEMPSKLALKSFSVKFLD